jgi:hypothetical protein
MLIEKLRINFQRLFFAKVIWWNKKEGLGTSIYQVTGLVWVDHFVHEIDF